MSIGYQPCQAYTILDKSVKSKSAFLDVIQTLSSLEVVDVAFKRFLNDATILHVIRPVCTISTREIEFVPCEKPSQDSGYSKIVMGPGRIGMVILNLRSAPGAAIPGAAKHSQPQSWAIQLGKSTRIEFSRESWTFRMLNRNPDSDEPPIIREVNVWRFQYLILKHPASLNKRSRQERGYDDPENLHNEDDYDAGNGGGGGGPLCIFLDYRGLAWVFQSNGNVNKTAASKSSRRKVSVLTDITLASSKPLHISTILERVLPPIL